jgi:hypothetical protein
VSQLPPPPPPPPVRRPRTVFVGTPGRLRIAAVASVAVCLLLGASLTGTMVSRSRDISTARNHAAQLVRIQAIRSNLTQADAAATNAFLVGGLEPPDQRASYAAGIAGATAAIAQASAGSSDDATTLAKTNQLLAQYAGLIESARANNRQGFPIGSAYLRQASNLLRLQMLPPLATLVADEQARITNAYNLSATESDALIAFVVIALVVLVFIQIWLSAKTRRTFNMGLATATVIVAIAGLVGIGVMAEAQHSAKDVRAGSLAATAAIASARTDAFDAKSEESLTLINRGSGQPFEAEYQTLIADAREALKTKAVDPGLTPLLDAYDTAHVAVRKADDGGNWDGAVTLATGNGKSGTKAAFTAFDTSSKGELAIQASRASRDLGSARDPLDATAGLLFLAGIAAAVLAWRGIAVRLREYR